MNQESRSTTSSWRARIVVDEASLQCHVVIRPPGSEEPECDLPATGGKNPNIAEFSSYRLADEALLAAGFRENAAEDPDARWPYLRASGTPPFNDPVPCIQDWALGKPQDNQLSVDRGGTQPHVSRPTNLLDFPKS